MCTFHVRCYPIHVDPKASSTWLSNYPLEDSSKPTWDKLCNEIHREVAAVANQVMWKLRECPEYIHSFQCLPIQRNYESPGSEDPTHVLFVNIFNSFGISVNIVGRVTFKKESHFSQYDRCVKRYCFLSQESSQAIKTYSHQEGYKSLDLQFKRGSEVTIGRIFSTEAFKDTLRFNVPRLQQPPSNTMAEKLYVETKNPESACDILIVVGNERIQAHSSVLFASQAQNYFSAALKKTWSESKTNTMTIIDADPQMVQILVRYLYLESFEFKDFSLTKLKDLIRMADLWGVKKAFTDLESYVVLAFKDDTDLRERLNFYSEFGSRFSANLKGFVQNSIIQYFVNAPPYNMNNYSLLFTCAISTKCKVLLHECCLLAMHDPSKELLEGFAMHIDADCFPILFSICTERNYVELLDILNAAKRFEKTLRKTSDETEANITDKVQKSWTRMYREEWRKEISAKEREKLRQEMVSAFLKDPAVKQEAMAVFLQTNMSQWTKEAIERIERQETTDALRARVLKRIQAEDTDVKEYQKAVGDILEDYGATK